MSQRCGADRVDQRAYTQTDCRCLGVGISTLNKWITAHRDTDVVSHEDRELALENERLRRENRILKEERGILKMPPSSSRAKSREVQVC